MAKRQTRRSISLRAEVFVRLQNFTQRTAARDTRTVEAALTEYLNREGEPIVTREEALTRLRGRIAPAPMSMPSAPVGEDEIEEIRRRAFG